MLDDPSLWLFAFAWFLAGFVNGISGMGAAMVALPIVAGSMDPAILVPATTVCVTIISASTAWVFWRHTRWHALKALLVGAVPGAAAGLGILLFEGIGDTIRVSLTADPVEEIDVAWELLRCLGLRYYGPEIISCPTCGRTEIDLIGMEKAVSERLKGCRANIRVAVMGCVVNGPGEAREADIGLAGGRDRGIIFRKGEIVRSVKGQDALLAAFMEELQKLLAETEQA